MERKTPQEFLSSMGLLGVGTYGLLSTNTSSTKMHEIMQAYADHQTTIAVTEALRVASEKAIYLVGQGFQSILIDERILSLAPQIIQSLKEEKK